MRVPDHHGKPARVEPTRRIQPTEQDKASGVKEVLITFAYCINSKCSKRFVFVQYDYGTHLGAMINRLRNRDEINSIMERVMLADKRNSVQGTIQDKTSGVWLFKKNIAVK